MNLLFGSVFVSIQLKPLRHLFSIFNIFHFLSDIFRSPFWEDAENVKDENLMERLPELKALIIDSKANNPVKKYSGGWKNERTGHYPKSAYYGSLLSERLNGAKQSCCTLRDSLVQHTMTSHNGRTRLGKPVSPKNLYHLN